MARSIPPPRSSSKGMDTTLTAKAVAANRKPTPTPMTAIAQPIGVCVTSRIKPVIEVGGCGPSVAA